jgi:hypothetical protein
MKVKFPLFLGNTAISIIILFHVDNFIMLSVPVECSKSSEVSISLTVSSLEQESEGFITSKESGANNSSDATPVLGGGEINEKPRFFAKSHKQHPHNIPDNYDPKENLSHLLHSIVGLDRYPNYLLRWTQNEEKDIDALEEALEDQLEKLRQQRVLLRKRREEFSKLCNDLATDDKPLLSFLQPPQTWDEVRDNVLHPKISNVIFGSRMFWGSNSSSVGFKEDMISVQEVINGKIVVRLDPHLVHELLDEEMPDVYSFPLLSVEVCLCKKHFLSFRFTDTFCYDTSHNVTSLVIRQTKQKINDMGHDISFVTYFEMQSEGLHVALRNIEVRKKRK